MHAGEEMPAELLEWEGVLESPNRFQFLVKMLESPDEAVEYLSSNCVADIVQDTKTDLLKGLLPPEEEAKLQAENGGVTVQCVDKHGALDKAARSGFSPVAMLACEDAQ